MPTKSELSGTRRADITGFGVPEHHGDSSALPKSIESSNLSFRNLVIAWMRVEMNIARLLASVLLLVALDSHHHLVLADNWGSPMTFSSH